MTAFTINRLHVDIAQSGRAELSGPVVDDYTRAVVEFVVRAADPSDPLHSAFDTFREALTRQDEIGPALRGEDRYTGGCFDARDNAAGLADEAYEEFAAELSESLTIPAQSVAGLLRVLTTVAGPDLRRVA